MHKTPCETNKYTSTIQQQLLTWKRKEKGFFWSLKLTCFNDIGNVNLAETSRVFTISFMFSLQLLQTPAQATTFFRGGQVSSDASILINTSLKSSGGIFAQQLCLKASTTTEQSWTTRWDLDLNPYPNFTSNPFLEILPSSPLMSWIILLNDILTIYRYQLNTIHQQHHKPSNLEPIPLSSGW